MGGYCFVPYGVQRFITSVPKTASLANLQASFPMVDDCLRWLLLARTLSIGCSNSTFSDD